MDKLNPALREYLDSVDLNNSFKSYCGDFRKILDCDFTDLCFHVFYRAPSNITPFKKIVVIPDNFCEFFCRLFLNSLFELVKIQTHSVKENLENVKKILHDDSDNFNILD